MAGPSFDARAWEWLWPPYVRNNRAHVKVIATK